MQFLIHFKVQKTEIFKFLEIYIFFFMKTPEALSQFGKNLLNKITLFWVLKFLPN